MFHRILVLCSILVTVLAGNGNNVNSSNSGQTITSGPTTSPTTASGTTTSPTPVPATGSPTPVPATGSPTPVPATASPTTSPTVEPASGASPGCTPITPKNFQCNNGILSGTIEGTDQCPAGAGVPAFNMCVIGQGSGNLYHSSVVGSTCTPSGNSVLVVNDAPPAGDCNALLGTITQYNQLCTFSPVGCPAIRRDRKLLTAANDYQEHGEEFAELTNRCGAFDFEASILVRDHIYLKATPTPQAKAAGCPAAMVHAVFAEHEDIAHKEVFLWQEASEMSESLEVGTFKFANVVQAVQAAHPIKADVAGYNVIQNNCGSFALNIAKELNISVNREMTSYVASRLLEHATNDMLDKIRQGFSFRNGKQQIRDGRDGRSLVQMLVQHTVMSDVQPV